MCLSNSGLSDSLRGREVMLLQGPFLKLGKMRPGCGISLRVSRPWSSALRQPWSLPVNLWCLMLSHNHSVFISYLRERYLETHIFLWLDLATVHVFVFPGIWGPQAQIFHCSSGGEDPGWHLLRTGEWACRVTAVHSRCPQPLSTAC